MLNRSGTVLLTMAFGLLAAAAPVAGAGSDPGINVTVTNPASKPVPVTVQGATTSPIPVAVQGTATVTGNVGIVNTANVAISNTPSVNVINDVTVRSADNPGLQPFRMEARIDLSVAGTFLSARAPVYLVPQGKRLVIEYIDSTFLINVPGTDITGKMALIVEMNDVPYTDHGIGVSSEAAYSPGGTIFVIGKTVRIYVEPGGQIIVNASGSISEPANRGFFYVTINGHLIDV